MYALANPPVPGAQWTGVVTQIAIQMLESGQVEAVVCVQSDEHDRFTPKPVRCKALSTQYLASCSLYHDSLIYPRLLRATPESTQQLCLQPNQQAPFRSSSRSDCQLLSRDLCVMRAHGLIVMVFFMQLVARSKEDIIKARGVKPTLSPNLNTLATVEALNVKRLLFIGVGCQVRAAASHLLSTPCLLSQASSIWAKPLTMSCLRRASFTGGQVGAS